MSIKEIRKEPRENIESFARVFRVVVEAERDGDHVQSNFITYGTLMKEYGEVVWPDGEPDEDDVETALRIARDYLSPSEQTMISVHVGRGLPEISNEELLLY